MPLSRFFKRRRWDEERRAEIQAYLDIETDLNISRGMSLEEACQAAHRKFGNPILIREEIYLMNTIALFESTWQDVRHGVRMLRWNPGFAAVAILSLALGIGANAAIFQLLDAVRLRSLPVSHPEQLVEVRMPKGTQGYFVNNGFDGQLTTPLWEQFRDLQTAFSGTFAEASDRFAITDGDQIEQHDAIWASGDLFNVLGVSPARGRLFQRSDDLPGCANRAVISYRYWQNHFAGRDSAIGARLIVDDQPFTILGVAPAGFHGIEVGSAFDVAIPICTSPAMGGRGHERRDVFWLTMIGRLKPGLTVTQASAQMNALSPGVLEATVPPGYTSQHVKVYKTFRFAAFPATSGISFLREAYNTSLWLLLAITGFVLLIACTNLTNLLLAKASARERELAVRLALGASRWRLLRQLFAESLLLAASGALAGAFVARFVSRAILWFFSQGDNGPQLDLSFDWRVLAFLSTLAALTCVVFGLFPALRASGAQPGLAIKSGGRGMTSGRDRFSFQRAMVVAQIAVCLVLVTGALLFVRSFRNILTFDPGFQEERISVARLNFSKMHLPQERWKASHQQLLDEIRAIPDIEDAASTTNVPLSGGSWTLGARVTGPHGTHEDPSKFTWISPHYFSTLRIPVLAGRDFGIEDTDKSQPVAIVNETFVRKFLGGGNPLGAVVRTIAEPGYPATVYTVVGEVKDTQYAGLRDDVPPVAFAPDSQFPEPAQGMMVMIRSSTPPEAAIHTVKEVLRQSHPQLQIPDSAVYQRSIRDGLVRERMMAALSGFFGGLAVILATIGLYGVISYIVTRRKGEIGVRLALGSSRGQVAGLILRESALVLLAGVAIGSVLAFALTRTASTLLFGLKADDPSTLIAAVSVMAVISLAASYIPAHRASQVDPMATLREE